jgi:hypothetical protein
MVRLFVTIFAFLLSQLMLFGYEAIVVAWPVVTGTLGRLFALPLPWAGGVGPTAIMLLLTLVWAVRKLLRRMPRQLRSATKLAVLVGALAAIAPAWWPWHLALTKQVIAWAEVNVSWLVFI